MYTEQPQQRKYQSVAIRLLLTVLAVFAVLIIAQTWLNIRSATQTLERREQQALADFYAQYQNEIAIRQDAANTLALSFADREDLRLLYLDGDREGLLDLLTPIFNVLSEEFDIVHLYLESLDGTVLVRVHNPERFGDDITYRRTAAAALENAELVGGVEIGPNRLGIRSVAPLFEDGEFVGLVEVGLDYDEGFMQSLKESYGIDFHMWVSQEAAAPAGLRPAEGAPAPVIPELFHYAGTTDRAYTIDPAVHERVLASGLPETVFVSDGGQELAVLVAPLLAYGDRIIGTIELVDSREEDLAALQSATLLSVATSGGVALAGFALVGLIIGGLVLRPLNQLYSVAEQWRRGDLTARVDHLPENEFGQLGQTYNTVAAELENTLWQQEQTIQKRTRDLELALQDVQQSRQFLTTLLESIPSPIFYKDAQGAYLGFNQSFLDYLGQPAEALLGKTVFDLQIDQALAQKYHDMDMALLENPEEPQVYESAVTYADGSLRTVIFNKSAFHNPDDSIGGLVGTMVDITERKRNEARISKQASELSTVADVATKVATTLNEQELLQEFVDLAKERFGLYHAHIYLLSDSGENLTLTAGAGDVGRMMVASGRSIPVQQEQSLVARAARTRRGVIINDVRHEPGFLPNPLLPETRAEMAVPLIVGERVLGVFDVQADSEDYFTESDVVVQTTLAAQVGVALQNARSFTQANRQRLLLARERALLNSLLNSVPDLIFYKDIEGMYLGCNNAFAEFVGRPEPEITGHTDYELFAAEVADFFREQDQEMLRLEETRINEEWVDYPDGRRVLLQTLKTPFYGPDGELFGLIGISRDITDRYQVEATLRESEARFRDVALSSADWVWEVDPNGVYTYCSDRVLDVLGYPVEEVLGKTPFDFMIPGEAERVGGTFAAAIGDQGPINDLQNWNLTKDGRSILLATSGVPRFNEAGELIGYRGIDRDITARHLAEETQRRLTAELESERRTLQAIFQSMPAGIFVAEAPSGRPLLTNDLAVEILGRGLAPDASKDDLAEVYEAYVYGTDDLYPVERLPLVRAMYGEQTTVEDMEVRRPDGRRVLVQVNGAPIYGPDGLVSAAMIAFQDITGRKQVELARDRLNRELEERLEQVAALQRAMTREGWETYLTATERPLQGFTYADEILKPIEQELSEVASEAEINLTEVREPSIHPERKMMAMPLQLHGETIGVIGARSASGEMINEEQRLLLTALSAQVAEALERARLFEETELGRRQLDTQARELAVINEVAQSVSQLLDPADLLETIFKQVQTAITADAFIVATYDEPSGMLNYPLVYDERQRFQPPSGRPTADNPWLQVVQTGQPSLLNRSPEDVAERLARLEASAEQRLGQAGKVSASLIFVPLFLGQKAVGAMSVQSYAHAAYNERDLALLTGIANHVAVALENARLYTETQRRAEREALVNAITQKIQSTLTVEKALETAVTELGRIFQSPYAVAEIALAGKQNGHSTAHAEKSDG
jgi:PAS domain S-box-containing protein